MALSIVGTATFGSSGTVSNFTLAYPAGIASNDEILVFCAGSDPTITWSSSGYTAVTQVNDSAGNNNENIQFFYKTAAGTESGNVNFAVSSSTHTGIAMMIVYRGSTNAFDPSTPSNSGQCNDSSSTTLTVSGRTTVNNSAKLVWFGISYGGTGSTSPPTITVPSGFTAETTFVRCTGAGTHNTGGILADMTQSVAGATGNENGTLSSSAPSAGLLVAIDPTVSNTTITPTAVHCTATPPLPVVILTGSTTFMASITLPAPTVIVPSASTNLTPKPINVSASFALPTPNEVTLFVPATESSLFIKEEKLIALLNKPKGAFYSGVYNENFYPVPAPPQPTVIRGGTIQPGIPSYPDTPTRPSGAVYLPSTPGIKFGTEPAIPAGNKPKKNTTVINAVAIAAVAAAASPSVFPPVVNISPITLNLSATVCGGSV